MAGWVDRDPDTWGGQGQGIWPVTRALSARNRDLVTAPDLPEDPADVWSELALTAERYKLLWEPATGRRRAFDLRRDPGETEDIGEVADLDPLWPQLERQWARAMVGELSAADRERILRRLKDLGYL